MAEFINPIFHSVLNFFLLGTKNKRKLSQFKLVVEYFVFIYRFIAAAATSVVAKPDGSDGLSDQRNSWHHQDHHCCHLHNPNCCHFQAFCAGSPHRPGKLAAFTIFSSLKPCLGIFPELKVLGYYHSRRLCPGRLEGHCNMAWITLNEMLLQSLEKKIMANDFQSLGCLKTPLINGANYAMKLFPPQRTCMLFPDSLKSVRELQSYIRISWL